MADMDQGLKRLIQAHPADMLALALPGAHFLSTVPTDLATEPQLALDTLQRVRYQGTECIVDIEAEARPRPEIARRCFEYGARATILHGLPTISVVLWLTPAGSVPPSPYELRVGDRLVAHWHFIGIEVYRLQADVLLQQGLVGLLPLIPFCQGGDTIAAVEEAARQVHERAPVEQVGELEALLAVFAARHLATDAILAVLRRLSMSNELVEESPLYHYWVRQAAEKATEQATREATEKALRGRFGELPAALRAALASAPVAALDDVLLHLTTESLEQLQARLASR